MLVELSFVVSVPAGSVDKIQVVRAFDKPHASFDQASGKQTTLAELATVASAQVGRFSVQFERFHEFRTGQSKSVFNCRIVVSDLLIAGCAFFVDVPHATEQSFAPVLPFVVDARKSAQPIRTFVCAGQVNVASLRSQKARAASDVWITNQHVSWCVI